MKKILILSFLVTAVLSVTLLSGMTMMEGVNPDCASAYVVENSTGEVLYAKNENDRRPIASMVKIMTLLLTFEAYDRGEVNLDDSVVISENAARQIGSELFLDKGVSYPLSDLIKGTVVVSGNDTSVAIAEHVAGSEEAFIERMNKRAEELDMKDTLFSNVTGLPTQEEQYSTAHDVNIMTRQLLKHKEYFDYSKIWVEDFVHPSGRITQLANTNKLVRFYKGCDGGKTGYTDSAKFCLSASAQRADMRLTGTVLGAENSKARFGAITKLFNTAFAKFRLKSFAKAGDEVESPVEIIKGREENFKAVYKEDLSILTQGKDGDYEINHIFNESISAPISKGETIGYAVINMNGNEIKRVELIAPRNIDKATYWDYVKKFCMR